jgi:hypothetical protein
MIATGLMSPGSFAEAADPDKGSVADGAAVIESECCREDTAAWEPCPPFVELQKEIAELRAARNIAVEDEEIADMICQGKCLHPDGRCVGTEVAWCIQIAAKIRRALANAKGDGS